MVHINNRSSFKKFLLFKLHLIDKKRNVWKELNGLFTDRFSKLKKLTVLLFLEPGLFMSLGL